MLQLFVDGVEQPLRVNGAANGRFDPQDSVEFYATGADTPYTGIRTYWIVAGDAAGRRIPVVDGRPGGVVGPSSFPSSVELKPRSIFFGALMNGDKENFFGPLIMPGESTQQVVDLPDVIAPAPADAEIEVALQGVTDVGHRVGVRVNGVDVGEVTFADRDAGVGTIRDRAGASRSREPTPSAWTRAVAKWTTPCSTTFGSPTTGAIAHGPTRSRSARTRVSRSPSPASPTPGSVSSTSPVTSRRTKCVAPCPATAPGGRSRSRSRVPARGR